MIFSFVFHLLVQTPRGAMQRSKFPALSSSFWACQTLLTFRLIAIGDHWKARQSLTTLVNICHITTLVKFSTLLELCGEVWGILRNVLLLGGLIFVTAANIAKTERMSARKNVSSEKRRESVSSALMSVQSYKYQTMISLPCGKKTTLKT